MLEKEKFVRMREEEELMVEIFALIWKEKRIADSCIEMRQAKHNFISVHKKNVHNYNKKLVEVLIRVGIKKEHKYMNKLWKVQKTEK